MRLNFDLRIIHSNLLIQIVLGTEKLNPQEISLLVPAGIYFENIILTWLSVVNRILSA